MSERFEFVPGDEIDIGEGRTLKRIRALVAIPAFGVNPGDLGGYAERADQIRDSAWISDSAWIRDSAWIGDSAWISGLARIGDSVQISGEALISGSTRIGGSARIGGDATVLHSGGVFTASGVGSECGTLTAVLDSRGRLLLTRGCFCGSAAEFLARSAAQHDERIQREYRMLIEVAASRLGVEVAA